MPNIMKMAKANNYSKLSTKGKVNKSGIANKIRSEYRSNAKKRAQRALNNNAARGARQVRTSITGEVPSKGMNSAQKNFFAENLQAGMSKAKSKRLQRKVINKSYKASIAAEKFKTKRSLARSAAVGGTVSKGSSDYVSGKELEYKSELARADALSQYEKLINGSQGEGNEAVNPNDKSSSKDKSGLPSYYDTI